MFEIIVQPVTVTAESPTVAMALPEEATLKRIAQSIAATVESSRSETAPPPNKAEFAIIVQSVAVHFSVVENMRWPQNAVSFVGRAGGLSPSKTYKLMRALRKHALNNLDQLWMLTSDRRHEKDTTVLTTELKADWCRVQKLLGRSRDKASNLVPYSDCALRRKSTSELFRGVCHCHWQTAGAIQENHKNGKSEFRGSNDRA